MKYLYKKLSLFVLFIIVSSSAFSQNKVNGSVMGKRGEKLSFANIIVYDKDSVKTITYTTSDTEGKYSLQLSSGTYLFKISYLGYEPMALRKTIDKDIKLNFKLTEDSEDIGEVVIEAEYLEAAMRGDTVKYNVKSLTTGNEENLKEVLEKLPGIEIGDDGKIMANGKKIDKLMIDGKDFFGNQHQLATQNITPKMIKGVTLLKNHKDFSDIDNTIKTRKTAMNIEIEDEYKNKVNGNVTAGGGYKNKYEFNANLFSFRTKVNVTFIANTNNVGNEVMSFSDFMNFQNGSGASGRRGGGITYFTFSGSIPSFLFANNDVKEKNEQFVGLNLSGNPTKRLKISGYVLFDRTDVLESTLAQQTYFNAKKPTVLNLSKTNDNLLLMNNSFFSASYKPNKKTLFDYTVSFTPDKTNIDIDDNMRKTKYNSDKDIKSYTLTQTLKYKQNLGKVVVEAAAYQTIENNKNDLEMLSDQPFLGLLFTDKNYSALQEKDVSTNKFGIETSVKWDIVKHLSSEISYDFSKNKETLYTDIKNNNLTNNAVLDLWDNTFGVSLYDKSKSFFNYEVGNRFSFLNSDNANNFHLQPFANITLNFTQSNSLHLSYSRDVELPHVENLILNNYISSFNTLTSNKSITENTFTEYDNFALSYSLHDLFSGLSIHLSVNAGLGKDIITQNTCYQKDYRINEYTLADDTKRIGGYVYAGKKLSKIPFKIGFSGSYSASERYSFINDKSSKFVSNNISNRVYVRSRFKKPFFNFSFGYRISNSIVENTEIKVTNTLTTQQPYFDLRFKYFQFRLNIEGSVKFYNGKSFDQTVYSLDPVFKYVTMDKKWEFFAKGHDVFNLGKNSIIENSVRDDYLEEKTIYTLGGYVMFGVKYNF